ncbi:alginate O-acetyltransferase [Bacteroidota bacterium]|nr:alginate O-acetyltransferase [Bacteroidota bacterium]
MFDKILHELTYHKSEPMLFNTGIFLFLFLVLLFFYQFVYKKENARITYLTLFSLYFYYKCGGLFFLLLILSTVIDYTIANFIYKSNSKRDRTAWLVLSLVINLGFLAYFKYTNFLLGIANDLQLGNFQVVDIVLPVGISFYTFQVLSYTIDVYRGLLKPAKNIFDFGFYISFFPHLVAGPIVRASLFLPQIHTDIKITKDDRAAAVFLILTGLFKKAVISDYISVNFVDRVFDAPALYTGFENLMAVYGYAMQIYCDFSGYSDMAIGVALLLGYRLGINFNQPYQSSSITEFWRRWHISLSSWLRDYLYVPLGGNRKGKLRQYVNLFITMLLGGLWHGASWNFVFWGFLHGVALAIDKLFRTIVNVPKTFLMRALGVLLTFHFVSFCWIFFRAQDFATATEMLSRIFGNFEGAIATQWMRGYAFVFALIVFGYLTHFIPAKWNSKSEIILSRAPIIAQSLALVFVIWMVIQVKSAEIQPFIYFQF